MKQLTTDEAKIKLVEKLHKEKSISFREALSLLEVEVRTEYLSYPYYPYDVIYRETNKIQEPLFTFTTCGNETYSFNN